MPADRPERTPEEIVLAALNGVDGDGVQSADSDSPAPSAAPADQAANLAQLTRAIEAQTTVLREIRDGLQQQQQRPHDTARTEAATAALPESASRDAGTAAPDLSFPERRTAETPAALSLPEPAAAPQLSADPPAIRDPQPEGPPHASDELLSAILAAVKTIGDQLATRDTPAAVEPNAAVRPGDAVRDIEIPQPPVAPAEPAAGLPQPVSGAQPRPVGSVSSAGPDVESLQQVIAQLQGALERSGSQTTRALQQVTGALRTVVGVVRQQMDGQRQLAQQVDQLASMVASLLNGGNERRRAQRGGYGV